MDQQKLIPLIRVTEDYGINLDHVKKAIKGKQLKAYIVGRAQVVDRGEVEAWIKHHEEGGGDDDSPN